MPDPAFVAAASASSGMGAYVVTVPKPTGTLEGHTMYAHIACTSTNSGGADDAHPSGWTVIPGGGGGKRIWYKVATATDETVTTDYTWDYTTVSTGFASAPVLGIIATYSDFGTKGLDSCTNGIFGGGSIGIPGFSGVCFMSGQYGISDYTPPTVTEFRYPQIIGCLNEVRGSATPPVTVADMTNTRATVSEGGMWAAIGANAAWTLTLHDILDQTVLHQVEDQCMVCLATDSTTANGNTTIGGFRNFENDVVTDIPFPPEPMPHAAQLELPQTRLNLRVLPNRLNDAQLDGFN